MDAFHVERVFATDHTDQLTQKICQSPTFLYYTRNTYPWRGSSVVEQRPEKPCVGGSIPLLATIIQIQRAKLTIQKQNKVPD